MREFSSMVLPVYKVLSYLHIVTYYKFEFPMTNSVKSHMSEPYHNLLVETSYGPFYSDWYYSASQYY